MVKNKGDKDKLESWWNPIKLFWVTASLLKKAVIVFFWVVFIVTCITLAANQKWQALIAVLVVVVLIYAIRFLRLRIKEVKSKGLPK